MYFPMFGFAAAALDAILTVAAELVEPSVQDPAASTTQRVTFSLMMMSTRSRMDFRRGRMTLRRTSVFTQSANPLHRNDSTKPRMAAKMLWIRCP